MIGSFAFKPKFAKFFLDCHIYLNVQKYFHNSEGTIINSVPWALQSETDGSILKAPPTGTPALPTSGYIRVVADSCQGCDPIRSMQCNGGFVPNPQYLNCDRADILCNLKPSLKML